MGAESRARLGIFKTLIEIHRGRKRRESLREANWAQIENVLTSGKGFMQKPVK